MNAKEMNDETRELLYMMFNGKCQCSQECVLPAEQVHHCLPNTIQNKKRFPLFIESIFNKRFLNSVCHLNKPVETIRPEQAEKYERWLELFLENKNI